MNSVARRIADHQEEEREHARSHLSVVGEEQPSDVSPERQALMGEYVHHALENYGDLLDKNPALPMASVHHPDFGNER